MFREEVEREFSARHYKIAAAKANGARDMDAWRKTRKQKDPDVEKSAVRSDWQNRIARHQAKTPEERAEMEAILKQARESREAVTA